MITISVITPCYNAALFVGDCIDSVQNSFTNQEFQIEHILVDDCSTDETMSTVQTIQALPAPNHAIQFIHQATHRGASAARNAGVAVAQGKYVFFLDADDVIFANSLRYLFEIAEKTASRWVYGDFIRGDDQLKYLTGQDYFGWKFESVAELLTSMYTGHHFFQQNSFFLKEALSDVQGFTEDLAMAEDFDLATKLLLKDILPIYLPGPLYMHRFHAHNASTIHLTQPDKHRQDIAKLFHQYQPALKKKVTTQQFLEIEKYLMDRVV